MSEYKVTCYDRDRDVLSCIYDPHGNAMSHGEIVNLINELQAEKTTASLLVGVMLSVRRSNTAAWMQGLADELNRWAVATGDSDRVATHGDGLQIIHKTF